VGELTLGCDPVVRVHLDYSIEWLGLF
jgi:hypothetical protein